MIKSKTCVLLAKSVHALMYNRYLKMKKKDISCYEIPALHKEEKKFVQLSLNGNELEVEEMENIGAILDDTIDAVLEARHEEKSKIISLQNIPDLSTALSKKLEHLKLENNVFHAFFTYLNPCSKSKKISAINSLIEELKKNSKNPDVTGLKDVAKVLIDGETGRIIKERNEQLFFSLNELLVPNNNETKPLLKNN